MNKISMFEILIVQGLPGTCCFLNQSALPSRVHLKYSKLRGCVWFGGVSWFWVGLIGGVLSVLSVKNLL